MERKDPVDFSSYFCFEASGDSEEPDCDPVFASEMPRKDGDDNDDALSCCNYDAEFNGDDEKEHDGEEEKSCVYGMSNCEDDEIFEEEKLKSYVSFDSGQECVDEMEKNRLFWEACLAS